MSYMPRFPPTRFSRRLDGFIRMVTKGKAIVQVFGNFHKGFGAENDNRGFELDRSYLGYEYKLGSGLSVKGVLDIGKSSDVSDYQRIAYIKPKSVIRSAIIRG